MDQTKPTLFESLLNSPDSNLAGEMMSLMASGKVKSETEAKGKAQLNNAVQTEDIQLLHGLLTKGASPNDSVFDDCLLTRAIWRGKIESVRLLIKFGADPNPNTGCPPLLQAINQLNVEAAKLLIAAGANVNSPNVGEQPELFSACLSCNQEMVALLLSHGAQIDRQGIAYVTKKHIVQNVTPLMIAAWQGTPNIVRLLLDSGATSQLKDAEGCNAIDWAKRCRSKSSREQVLTAFSRD